MQDLTGQPPTDADVIEATQVLKKFIVLHILELPPGLAVQLPNVLRCLKHYQELRDARQWQQHVWGRP